MIYFREYEKGHFSYQYKLPFLQISANLYCKQPINMKIHITSDNISYGKIYIS